MSGEIEEIVKTKGFYAAERKWEIILQACEERKDWVNRQLDNDIQPATKFEEEAADLDQIIAQVNRTVGMFDCEA